MGGEGAGGGAGLGGGARGIGLQVEEGTDGQRTAHSGKCRWKKPTTHFLMGSSSN